LTKKNQTYITKTVKQNSYQLTRKLTDGG